LREAWADKQPHRFLPFDRDAKFGADVVSAAKHRKSANTHGLSQSVAERCGGAPGGKCRRDLPDRGIIRKGRHLKRPRSAYLAYYHEDRTHLGLAKDTPAGRPTAVPLWNRKQDSIPAETRRLAPSVCSGSVESRAAVFQTTRRFLLYPAEARFRISVRIFVGRRISLQSQAEEVAPSSAKPLVMEGTTIWRTTTGRKCRRRREDRVGLQSAVSSAS
jgi:hypothetical protein